MDETKKNRANKILYRFLFGLSQICISVVVVNAPRSDSRQGNTVTMSPLGTAPLVARGPASQLTIDQFSFRNKTEDCGVFRARKKSSQEPPQKSHDYSSSPFYKARLEAYKYAKSLGVVLDSDKPDGYSLASKGELLFPTKLTPQQIYEQNCYLGNYIKIPTNKGLERAHVLPRKMSEAFGIPYNDVRSICFKSRLKSI